MSAVNLSSRQEELVKKAALESGFKEFDIVANSGSIKGDNYLGVIHTVSVKEKNTAEELHLILKCAHTNEVFRKEAVVDKLYKREAYLYSAVIPEFLKLQDEKDVSLPFTGVAKFYGYCLEDKQETILLQNLKMHGYNLWDRTKPMDDEHLTLAFAEYARLHAASLAFKQLHPEEFKELTKDIEQHVFVSDDAKNALAIFENMIDVNFTYGLNAVRTNPRATAALKKLRNDIMKLYEELKGEGKDSFVVTHGDCWCNNMLFSYEDDQNHPTKVCFIDWQLSSLTSPTPDLAYFFCVSSPKELFPNLNKYLTIYHEQLSQNLREFGCDPDEVFSFEALKDEWKSKSWYGVFIALMIIKLMLSDSEEAPNVSEVEDKQKKFMESMTDFKMSREAEVEARLCDLIDFMIDNKYL